MHFRKYYIPIGNYKIQVILDEIAKIRKAQALKLATKIFKKQ